MHSASQASAACVACQDTKRIDVMYLMRLIEEFSCICLACFCRESLYCMKQSMYLLGLFV